METWKPVYGWEDYYEVSDLGRVRSKPRKGYAINRIYGGGIVTPTPNGKGYVIVRLCAKKQKNRYIHSLVLESFVGPRPKGCEAAHNDNNRSNNLLSNLRWATKKENMADKIKHGTIGGEYAGGVKLTASQAIEIYNSPLSETALSKRYGVTRSQIGRIKRGERWMYVTAPRMNI